MERAEQKYVEAQKMLDLYIRDHKMRKTPERFEVLKVICGLDGLFTIGELMERMKRDASFCVSRSSLFKTLGLFEQVGLLIRHGQTRITYYEFNDGDACQVFLVCQSCGMMRPMERPDVLETLSGMRVRNFMVRRPILYLYGFCRKCKDNPIDKR